MAQVDYIRKMFFEKGMNYAEIARETGHDVKTVRKYIEKEDFSQVERRGPIEDRGSKLDPFKDIIDEWLTDDMKARRKQRHTAKRVFDRLKDLHKAEFNCSYRLTAEYVRQKKRELYGNRDSYLPLKHIPGEAQADFGEADFYEGERKYSGYYINVSFPSSNCGYFQIFKGQNLQCLVEGLKSIFSHIGQVPTRIWFDNASSMVKKILKDGERELTDGFIRFKNHYGFQSAFCNPSSGHEKGSVESKVGYHRRNFLVPVPRFTDIEEFNQSLLLLCDKDMDREHYAKNSTIYELFDDDKKAMLNLPDYDFDESELIAIKTNGYAKFILNGRHTYSTSPQYASTEILVKLTANEVIAMDKSYREIQRHKRLYGDFNQESMEWLPYLVQLSKRPAALKYTGIYDLLPAGVKIFLGECDNSNKKEILTTLSQLSEKSGFDKAIDALVTAVEHGTHDADSVIVTYNRLNDEQFDFSSFTPKTQLPVLPAVNISTNSYDSMLSVGGGHR